VHVTGDDDDEEDDEERDDENESSSSSDVPPGHKNDDVDDGDDDRDGKQYPLSDVNQPPKKRDSPEKVELGYRETKETKGKKQASSGRLCSCVFLCHGFCLMILWFLVGV